MSDEQSEWAKRMACSPTDPCGSPDCDWCAGVDFLERGTTRSGSWADVRWPLPDAEPAAVDDEPAEPWPILDTAAVLDMPPPEPLIGEHLRRDSLAMLYSDSGAGKTFLAIDWTLSIATGEPWQGHAVVEGPVLYVIGEGASGIGPRVKAWASHHRSVTLDGLPIGWVPVPVDLHALDTSLKLERIVDRRRPVLVVIDTLARCLGDAEENSNSDMGRIVEHLDRVRRSVGCCVLLLHHAGKDKGQGARGASALRAALDTELLLTAAGDRLTLTVEKQRDGAEAGPVRLRRVPAVDSIALVPDRAVDDDDTMTAPVAAALDVLRSIDVPGGVSAPVWATAAGVHKATLLRHLHTLLKLGHVVKLGPDGRPTYALAAPPLRLVDAPDQDDSTSTEGGGE